MTLSFLGSDKGSTFIYLFSLSAAFEIADSFLHSSCKKLRGWLAVIQEGWSSASQIKWEVSYEQLFVHLPVQPLARRPLVKVLQHLKSCW